MSIKMENSFKNWIGGVGVIQHTDITQERIKIWIQSQPESAQASAIALFKAADHLCSMAMWLTVHMTYAQQVYVDGRLMQPNDMKANPEGHTGGALNMVPAYVGYLLANALSGKTRSWLMGQGHCVAAIDAVNVLMRNLDAEQDKRYTLSSEGLSQLCQDFYSYSYDENGQFNVPIGSHVNAYTAGGIIEGGYLGFADLQYMHMPLPGQSLVTFLSDGAFEEQRGSDWGARWWRGEDTGWVMPIMIANGRRIDQRCTMTQSGGVEWFRRHLQLNGFTPVDIDGRDPAAFAWAILTMEDSLSQSFEHIKQGTKKYPLPLPYAIAETVKGFGFPGAGTNAAHNLPLVNNPHFDIDALHLFNEGSQALFVPFTTLQDAIALLRNHKHQRVLEKDHALRRIVVKDINIPHINILAIGDSISPMAAIDEWFVEFIKANPGYRVRVGNPDEMRSNRMNKTLDLLKHRVTSIEDAQAESVMGEVITALNEEAVVSAALANKQGINAVVSYEAFAVKMLGAMRQEIIFSRNMRQANKSMSWLGVPIIVTSHTWENGKNEQSHQDPTLCEAWMGEMSDVAPVYFPIDAPTAIASMQATYQKRSCIATIVASKSITPVMIDAQQVKYVMDVGAAVIMHNNNADIQFLTIGTYQLHAALACVELLQAEGLRCSVVAIIEPGKFRLPRDKSEEAYVLSDEQITDAIPFVQKRVVVSHTRPEIITGILRRLDTGYHHTKILGYSNHGGTLDILGMLMANGISAEQLKQQALKLLINKH